MKSNPSQITLTVRGSAFCEQRRRKPKSAWVTTGLFFALILSYSHSSFAQTVHLRGNLPNTATLAQVGRLDPNKRLVMEVVFAVRDRDILERELAQRQNPNSPLYHVPMSAQEFTARFGPTRGDFLAVLDWLKSEGFTIQAVRKEEGYIRVVGKVSLTEHAFQLRIATYIGGRFYANTSEPVIPARFAKSIGFIDGLDNFALIKPANGEGSPARKPERGTSVTLLESSRRSPDLVISASHSDGAPEVKINGTTAFGPSDIYTFYDEKPLLAKHVNGSGAGCIAIVGDSGFLVNAVALFDHDFNVKPFIVPKTVLADATNPGINADESEALIDMEWAHALAPGASIRFYLGDPSVTNRGTALRDAISSAVTENACDVISISFEACGGSPGYFTSDLDGVFMRAEAQMQTILVASGDHGSAGLCFVPPSVNEISADAHVTSVGGTQFVPHFDPKGNDVGFVPELVWNDKDGASGGGASALFTKPSYQSGPGVALDGRRDVPDVSLISGAPHLFYVGDVGGRPQLLMGKAGTSFAAPMWAGITMLIVQTSGGRVGNLNPRIYQLGQIGAAFPPAVTQFGGTCLGRRDVTTGGNGFNGVPGFAAGPWYDQATGWGTVDIARFVNAFTNPAIPGVPGSLTQLLANGAYDLTAGPDGDVWFATFDGGLAKITPAGRVASILSPRGIGSFTLGSDGNFWVSANNITNNPSILRVTPAGKITGDFSLANGHMAFANGVVSGLDGVWFIFNDTDTGGGYLGKIAVDGNISAVVPFTTDLVPPVLGPDGKMCYVQNDSNGRCSLIALTPSGSVASDIICPINQQLISLAVGSDGNIWFDEYTLDAFNNIVENSVGRTGPSGIIEFPVEHLNDYLGGLSSGPAGDLYIAERNFFSDEFENYIDVIDPSGRVSQLSTPGYKPVRTIMGPDCGLWIETFSGAIARLSFNAP